MIPLPTNLPAHVVAVGTDTCVAESQDPTGDIVVDTASGTSCEILVTLANGEQLKTSVTFGPVAASGGPCARACGPFFSAKDAALFETVDGGGPEAPGQQ